MNTSRLEFDFLREQIVGVDSEFEGPFGKRMLVYCDYTASGRSLRFIEEYLMGLQRYYANTHTEDDVTGRSMTQLMHDAELSIKNAVHAGPRGKIITCGTGATAAIDKFQQIVGVLLPPATRMQLKTLLHRHLGEETSEDLEEFVRKHRPVVFVGPYEHHSNEVTWREGLATVVEVNLSADGGVDLDHLEHLLKDPQYRNRPRIGSFSAASNVTGYLTAVHDVARLLHRHDALACFDYAASAPYVEIDMNPPSEAGDDPSLDAVFISPHKFLGGPGSSGVLIFNERIYNKELSPTVGGGGTVDYVGYTGHDFTEDIEERERAGTPGVLQVLKAALAFQVKEAVGGDRIAEREDELCRRALERFGRHPRIEILGNPDPGSRLAIVSFNLKGPEDKYLHPKFVTKLINDLFGIQSRAGCSCAGPYGHRLLDIDVPTSERYRAWIRKGYHGIKPGWCRLCFHYVMDDAEVDFIIEAVEFLADHGHAFLPFYEFDLHTGAWNHRGDRVEPHPFSLAAALEATPTGNTVLPSLERKNRYREYLEFARREAEALTDGVQNVRLDGEAGSLQYFALSAHPEARR